MKTNSVTNGKSFMKIDVRYQIVITIILLILITLMRDTMLLTAMMVMSFIVYYLSNLQFEILMKRLIVPSVFVLITSIFILICSRQNAVNDIFIIISRFVSIFTFIMILFETNTIMSLVQGMKELGLTSILADIILFTYRYIFQIMDDLVAMQVAMKMRGFRINKISDLKEVAMLIGTMFIRSYEQSERVYHAMVLRGYGS